MKNHRGVFLILIIPSSCYSQVFSASKVENVFALVETIDSIAFDKGVIDTVLIDKSDTTVYAHLHVREHKADCTIKTGEIVLYSLSSRKDYMKIYYGGNIYQLYFYSGKSILRTVKMTNNEMECSISYTKDKLLKGINFKSRKGNLSAHLMKFGYKEVYDRLLTLVPLSLLN